MNTGSLEGKIEEIIVGLDGRAGVVIRDFGSGWTFARREAEVFPAASLIKLAIIGELFRRIELGELNLAGGVTIGPADRVGGFGILKELHAGIEVTLEDLATLMIIVSDNTATNLLIDRLGIDFINRHIDSLGLGQTRLQRKMMDVEAARAGRDNFTSPADMARWLEGLVSPQGTQVAAASQAKILDIMKRQQVNTKLPALLPPGTTVAHKTGDLPGVEHDVGFIYIPAENGTSNPVLVAVMTADLKDNSQGIRAIGLIGRDVYDHFAPGS